MMPDFAEIDIARCSQWGREAAGAGHGESIGFLEIPFAGNQGALREL